MLAERLIFRSMCVFISIVFFPSLLLFQTFRLSVPGGEIDSDDDGPRAGDDGKGSCSIYYPISLGLED